MSIKKKRAIDKIAEKLKSRLEETGHQVELKTSEDELGYWLNFHMVKTVNNQIWTRAFSITDTLPTPSRYPRFQMIYKYHPKMNLIAIFNEVRIDPSSRRWPTDMVIPPEFKWQRR